MRLRTLILIACFVVPVLAGLTIAYKSETGFSGPDPAMVQAGWAIALIPALAGTVVLIVLAARAHRRWISQFTPGQQRLIRSGERLLALGALDASLHQVNHRTARNADLHGQVNQYMLRPLGDPVTWARGGLPGDPTGTALHAQLQQAPWHGLPGDPTAATQGLLEQSRQTRQAFSGRDDGWR
jgi:hypothetical protein